MNPNNPNNLDPKLKEAYESVMSGDSQPQPQEPIQNTSQQTQQTNQSPIEQASPKMETQEVKEEPQVQNISQPPFNTNDDVTQSPLSSGGGTFVNPNLNPSSVVDGDSPVKPKKKNSLMPLILGVGILVFFVIYAVVWAKLFGLF